MGAAMASNLVETRRTDARACESRSRSYQMQNQISTVLPWEWSIPFIANAVTYLFEHKRDKL